MNAHALRWDADLFAQESDRQFNRLLLAIAVPFTVLAILTAVYKIQRPKPELVAYVAPAIVELIQAEELPPQAEEEEQPAPAKEDTPLPPQEVVQPKKVDKPTPKPVVVAKPTPNIPPQPQVIPVPNAREVAKRSGVLAFSDQLNDLRSKGTALDNQALSSNVLASTGAANNDAGGNAQAGGAASIAAAAAGSSGIGEVSSGAVARTQSGEGLGKRATTKQQSPIGTGRDATRGKGTLSPKASGRNTQEIQLVFDRAQGSFQAMYVRAQRENLSLAGKIVFTFTIQPDGSISDADIVSSQLGDPELEEKLLKKVRSLKFEARDVPAYTYPRYPITFKTPE